MKRLQQYGRSRGLSTSLKELEEAQLAVGVASSGSESRISLLLRQLELKKHFHAVVTGDELRMVSPIQPSFLRRLKNCKWILPN